jgi:hypothetical protein
MTAAVNIIVVILLTRDDDKTGDRHLLLASDGAAASSRVEWTLFLPAPDRFSVEYLPNLAVQINGFGLVLDLCRTSKLGIQRLESLRFPYADPFSLGVLAREFIGIVVIEAFSHNGRLSTTQEIFEQVPC